MKPAILGVSNAIFGSTAYSRQMYHILVRLKEEGYNVANLGWYGLDGTTLTWHGIRIFPGYGGMFGVNVVGGDAKQFGADMVLTFQDIWPLPENYRERCLGVPWAVYFPVDTTPVAQRNVEIAALADWPIVYSKFGLEQMAEEKVECEYIPHMIDTSVFKPGDKEKARETLAIPKDAYVVSMVAANKGYPSRKAFPENLSAFKMFLDKHPEAFLYMHSQTTPMEGEGIEFYDLLPALDIPSNKVQFVNQLALANGLPDWYVALVYQASDVLLSASRAEGFGLPIVEAQACGCPVITTNCSSMTELTFNGIATEPIQREWYSMGVFGPGSWHFIPSVQNIYQALEEIYAWDKGEREENSQHGIDQVQKLYSCEVVVKDYWLPFLEKAGKDIENGDVEIRYQERKARVDAENMLKDRMRKIRDYTPKVPKKMERVEE